MPDREAASRLAVCILEAAAYFLGRLWLPEIFAGYPRSQTRFPVEYPTACSPQAWSTAAPLLLLRVLLVLEPTDEGIEIAPSPLARSRSWRCTVSTAPAGEFDVVTNVVPFQHELAEIP
jgi:glycogen debranching enzyme